ncbi:FecR family protein [Solimonas flava]|uniref:FecR family protein n=1 Tax=Solimonas flava TaxID=415849 RepID=UPI00040585AC|nr:FecR domain-containing protein [Solimonas flava]
MRSFFHRTPRSAPEWIARLRSNTATAADFAAFEAWLAAHPEQRPLVLRLQAVSGLAPGLAASPRIRGELRQLAERPLPMPAARRWQLGFAAAAGIVLAVTLLVWQQADVYRTPVGQNRMLALPDGSTIWLNTDSRLRLRFNGTERRVELQRGEAFFDVAHDASRPFVVASGERRVVVTGTRFDVRQRHGALEVAVLQGHVRVDAGGHREAAVVPPTSISAGQIARFEAAAPPRVENDAGVGLKTAWRDGKIVLDDSRLDDAIDELNRYTRTRLVLDDPALAELTISGTFRIGDTDSVLFALHELYGIEHRSDGSRTLLFRRAPAAG